MQRRQEERVRESFLKVKQDILLLKESIETIFEEVKGLKETLQSLSLRPVLDKSKESLSLDSLHKESKSKPAEKIIKKAEKNILMNMKRMIKKEILNIIEHKTIVTISHLQTIICDERQLCSRASFFNYMKELKEESAIINKTLHGQRITQTKEASETKDIQRSLNF